MNLQYPVWAGFLILSLVGSGISMKALSLQGISYSDSLFLRGLFCLLLVVIFSRRTKMPLLPKSVKTQVVRALLAGLALTFFTLSYNWLSASAIAVLSNIDVPMLLVLGPLIGIKATKRIRSLSLVSIAFLVFFVANLEIQPGLLYGLMSLALGTTLLCFGYMFIKKSMTDENAAITILTPSLAIVFYGLLESLVFKTPSADFSKMVYFEAFISGLCMFGAYYATMKLYNITDIATAEFPTLLSSILIQPAELLFLSTPMHPIYLLSSLGFVVVTFVIMLLQNRQSAVLHE